MRWIKWRVSLSTSVVYFYFELYGRCSKEFDRIDQVDIQGSLLAKLKVEVKGSKVLVSKLQAIGSRE